MKWISLETKKRPKACYDILFTDGRLVFKGWIESCDPEEDLSFVNEASLWSEDGITHWMYVPKPPKVSNGMD